jgi:phenylacetate-coenzyme A ligase PaaK-like adenylate-forming protein
MKKIGLLRGMRLCSQFRALNEADKEKIRRQRLHETVSSAKEKSPYYRELYKNLGDEFSLTDLPPVNKVDLMAHFDDWITDRSVKLADINEFMQNYDNIGRKFHSKYLVFTTSGSTGNPLVTLCDKTSNSMMGAINAMRTFARKEDLKAFFRRGGKTIGVFATGGYYLACSSVRARQLSMPWKKKQMAVTSALLPVSQIVRDLNAFQPAMLGGYPTVLELLIDEQKSGRLKIKPAIIMSGGEYLSDEVRKRLSESFGCYVQTSYSCTEGGTIACECTEHHFHVNDDWIIIEPVDRNNNPVPDGVQSDKILLTNLFNFTQPYIRYEVTDRVVMHHDLCACGNPSPWLTLEGRMDDIMIFTENGTDIKIAPLALYATFKEIHEIRRFQLIAHRSNRLELRLVPTDGCSKNEVFGKASKTLRAFLAAHGVSNVEIMLSEEDPKQHPKSGKFKHIINMTD